MGCAGGIAAMRRTTPREHSPRHRPAALHSFYEHRRTGARIGPALPARRRRKRQGLDLDGEAARVDSNKEAIGRRRVAAGARGPELAGLARPTIVEGAAARGRHPRHGPDARDGGRSLLGRRCRGLAGRRDPGDQEGVQRQLGQRLLREGRLRPSEPLPPRRHAPFLEADDPVHVALRRPLRATPSTRRFHAGIATTPWTRSSSCGTSSPISRRTRRRPRTTSSRRSGKLSKPSTTTSRSRRPTTFARRGQSSGPRAQELGTNLLIVLPAPGLRLELVRII